MSLLLIIAYPCFVHWFVLGGGPAVLWAALMIPALVLLLTARPGWGPACIGAVAAAGLAAGMVRIGVASYLLFIPPIAINLMLLALFVRSLRGPGPALVTRIAQFSRTRPLPREIVVYTRHVTWTWCALFAVMALANLLLAVLAPLEIWSLFANFINYLIVAMLFAGEYAVRRVKFPRYGHAGFIGFLRHVARIDYRKLGRSVV